MNKMKTINYISAPHNQTDANNQPNQRKVFFCVVGSAAETKEGRADNYICK